MPELVGELMALLESFPTLQMDDPVLAWDSSKTNSRVLSSLTVTV